MKIDNYRRTRNGLICTALVVLAQAALASPAKNQVYTPTAGNREHKAILGALRKPVTKFNKNKPFALAQVNMKVSGGWAYVDAVTIDAKGQPVGPDFTNELASLLRKTKGRWNVVKWAYATDVISMGWEKEYPKVPRKLWPHRR